MGFNLPVSMGILFPCLIILFSGCGTSSESLQDEIQAKKALASTLEPSVDSILGYWENKNIDQSHFPWIKVERTRILFSFLCQGQRADIEVPIRTILNEKAGSILVNQSVERVLETCILSMPEALQIAFQVNDLEADIFLNNIQTYQKISDLEDE